jgi:hypothetical protein
MSDEELVALFRGDDAVIACIGFAAWQRMQLRLARAVLTAGVRRFLPWQFGVDYDAIVKGSGMILFDEQVEVRDMLRAGVALDAPRTEWVIVSTGVFTSFVFEESFELVERVLGKGVDGNKRPVVRALGRWDNRRTVTAVEDVGVLTAHIVFAQEVWNQAVFVMGEKISYRRLADVVEKVTGRTVERDLLEVNRLKQDAAGDPGDVLERYKVVLAEEIRVAWNEEDIFNQQRSIETGDAEA